MPGSETSGALRVLRMPLVRAGIAFVATTIAGLTVLLAASPIVDVVFWSAIGVAAVAIATVFLDAIREVW